MSNPPGANAKANDPHISELQPQQLDAEMAVLGAMMLGDIAANDTAGEMLTGADFCRNVHTHIFDAMRGLAKQGVPVEMVTLKAELTRLGIFEQVGGEGFLFQLGGIEFTTANIAHYAQIVKACAVRRELMQAAQDIYQSAKLGETDTETLLNAASKSVSDCAKKHDTGAVWHSTRSLIDAAWDRIDAKRARGGGMNGISTGLCDVDDLLGGLGDSELIILAARPSMGKTACATTIAMNAAKPKGDIAGNVVAFFSAEMDKEAITNRFLAAEGQIDLTGILNGDFAPDAPEWGRLADAQRRLWDMRLFIDDTPNPSVSVLEGRARKIKAEQGGLDLIVVDYLQNLRGPEGDGGRYSGGDNRTNEVSQIVVSLKALARRLQVPVIALSQLSRAVEKRDNKRPMLSDLYESGRLEAEADKVCFLYRPSYYEQKADASEAESDVNERDPVEFIVAKNRNGRTGFVKIGFAHRFTRFDNLVEGVF